MLGDRAPFRIHGFHIVLSGGNQGTSVAADACASESKDAAAGIAAILPPACNLGSLDDYAL